ncbi:YciI family protein [Glutamicibacter sp.]|uniref:YciI family protein n=1 Tax=Glutamicibacter sp. TaxID=1931995 RepID=UPI0028BF5978|nr:YciI family protein [Glutamicibacter sp.]
MTVFAVEYVYAENSAELRNEHRPSHREYLGGFVADDGNVRLLASGPTPSNDGALLIMAAETEAELVEALNNDPFKTSGAVQNAIITEWNPVTGLLKEFAS